MKRLNLKLAIVTADLRNQDVAHQANELLGAGHRLSELDVSKILTGRKDPKTEQRAALATVLGSSATDLFPDLTQEASAS